MLLKCLRMRVYFVKWVEVLTLDSVLVEGAESEVFVSEVFESETFASKGFDALTTLLSPPMLLDFSAVLPPRKSVTYQPDPFRAKPAAVTCLLKVSLPQAGHVVSGASDIFCRASLL